MTTMKRISRLPERDWSKNRGVISHSDYDMISEIAQECCWGAPVSILSSMVPDEKIYLALEKINKSSMNEWAQMYSDGETVTRQYSCPDARDNVDVLRIALDRYISGLITGAIEEYVKKTYIIEEYLFFGDDTLKRLARKRGWEIIEKFE